MSKIRMRILLFVVAVTVATALTTRSASAHGLGDGAELGVSAAALAWGAGFVVLISFAAFGVLWRRPHLSSVAKGRPLPRAADSAIDLLIWPARVLVGAVYVVTITAAFDGSAFAVLNVAPWVVFIGLAVAMPVVSFLFGDVWRAVSPLRSLARLAAAAGTRLGLRRDRQVSDWPAAVSLAAFVWLELAYHASGSPAVLSWLLIGYSGWAVLPAARYGVDWTDRADGLGWWFSTIATMSIWTSDENGRRLRWPFTGAVEMEVRAGSTIAVLVMIGGTTFDGVSRTSFWGDVAGDRFGWGSTLIATLGLVWTIAIVISLYLGVSKRADQWLSTEQRSGDAFLAPMLPIALGYAIAHTFASLIFDGQTLLIRASDPYGDGSNWFGTAGWIENTRLVSSTVIAWVQIIAIVLGHVMATMLAHDRAVALTDDPKSAVRSQYAMVIVMVVFTAAGLLLLVDG